MMCPKCRHESKVIDSGRRKRPPTEVPRRRECLNPACRYRWNTVEINAKLLTPRPERTA